jgi:hypothetical protein
MRHYKTMAQEKSMEQNKMSVNKMGGETRNEEEAKGSWMST